MARKKSVIVQPPNLRGKLAKMKWDKVMYDKLNGIEKAEESTKHQKPLRLGKKNTLRRRLRSFRVRVAKLRIRIRISPSLWLRKFADAYVRMMLGVQDKIAGGGVMKHYQRGSSNDAAKVEQKVPRKDDPALKSLQSTNIE